ncbi:CHAT domain protein [Ceratobasidium sp. AG-Ba]|nr:CHAT domain protein [Ceratobasidium sp. AG-Ba]
MEDHKRLLLEYIEEERFDQMALVDKILLDLAFMLAEDQAAARENLEIGEYFNELDLTLPYRLRLRKGVLLLQRGAAHVSNTDKWKPHVLSGVALLLKLCFEDSGQMEDIEEAIRYGEEAIAFASANGASLPLALDILGDAYAARFDYKGDPQDIRLAVEHRLRGIRLCPSDHKERAVFLNNLGASMIAQSQHFGNLQDLDHAIEFLREALMITPDDSPTLPSRLNKLGIALKARFDRLGQVTDIESAIEHQTRALLLLVEGHADKPMVHGDIARSYLSRYRQLENLEDLNSSIMHSTKAITLAAGDTLDAPVWLHTLGSSLQSRFERQGELRDLDKAIEHFHDAVRLTQERRRQSDHLVGLGTAYAIRYTYLKNISDVENSIDYYNQALFLEPAGLSRALLLNNLGNVWFRRFEQFQNHEDMDNSVRYYVEAVAAMPNEDTTKLLFLSNLAQAYSKRFKYSQQVEDIEDAVAHLSEAILLTPENHTFKRSQFILLANSLHLRFKYKQEKEDLNLCITHALKALSLTPDGHIDKIETLRHIGEFYRTKFQYYGDPSAIDQSIGYLQEALSCTVGRPFTRFLTAWDLCASLRLARPNTSLISVYKQVMELLPQIVWLGSDISDRYENISDIEGIALGAAAAAIDLHEIDLALEWIEAGSSIVWKQMNALRMPFHELQDQYPQLAQQLTVVARQLSDDGIQAPEASDFQDTEIGVERVNQKRHRLCEEWEQLLNRVRLLPGFANFLRLKTAAELMGAAQTGDVVVINLHQSRCDALILSNGNSHPIHLPLPGFSYEKAVAGKEQLLAFLRESEATTRGFRASHSRAGQGIRSLLALLWEEIVKPVIDRLGYLKRSESIDLPRISWCLTGLLTFLPLHAAGLYAGTGTRTFEFIVSSYIPTPSTSLFATPPPGNPKGILAVAQPNVLGLEFIPQTLDEILRIKDQVGETMKYTCLVGEQATAAAVLDEMGKHSWVHFACHATQDPLKPLDSSFLLYESKLELRTIMATSLGHASFAFLSACQTAMGDEKFSEQAVHLAGGMVMAGYSSVIATIWSIQDQDGPDIAEKFYHYMLEGGSADSRKAARALHAAVGHLRDHVGESAFARWVPFAHIGV